MAPTASRTVPRSVLPDGSASTSACLAIARRERTSTRNATRPRGLAYARCADVCVTSGLFFCCFSFAYIRRWLHLKRLILLRICLADNQCAFRDFVPRLELLILYRDFRKGLKISKMNNFSLFCKLCLVLFLTLIMALRFYAAPPQI